MAAFVFAQGSPTACAMHDLPLFSGDTPLNFTILSDFRSIMDDRGEDRSYHKARLYYLKDSGDTVKRKIKLKTRGNFRRDPVNCKYPPIMVKFGKQKMIDPVFSGQSKLKLVTQCQLEQYVLLEYLAYRINNLLTDISFRVRLAHVTYADLESKDTYFTRYAFFIENEKAMADRLNAAIYEPNAVQSFLVREQMITMALFQYLIGNNDWYVTSKHNNVILRLNETEDLVSVPYDFDWSKIVDAEYTKPSDAPEYMLKPRRIYKGLCMNHEDLEYQRQVFDSLEEVILELPGKIEGLSLKSRKSSIAKIEKFYDTLHKTSSLKQVFQREECVQIEQIPGKLKRSE